MMIDLQPKRVIAHLLIIDYLAFFKPFNVATAEQKLFDSKMLTLFYLLSLRHSLFDLKFCLPNMHSWQIDRKLIGPKIAPKHCQRQLVQLAD